eukprot:6366346-Pyramimonas_sp.AAC.1
MLTFACCRARVPRRPARLLALDNASCRAGFAGSNSVFSIASSARASSSPSWRAPCAQGAGKGGRPKPSAFSMCPLI